MKSYKEFRKLTERYYEPDEPLPSGKTPKGKATSSHHRQVGEYFRDPQRWQHGERRYNRLVNQRNRRYNQVSRGADNPNLDFTPDRSGQYGVSGNSKNMSITKDGIGMTIRQKNKVYFDKSSKTRTGKMPRPIYDIEWYNNKDTGTGRNNPGQARSTVRKVADMWKSQVERRLPRNAVISNFPVSNDTSTRNTRAKLYSKVANFGPRSEVTGHQFGKVGNNPSSKQFAKGTSTSRIRPLTPGSGDVSPFMTGDEIDRFNANREPKFKPYGNSTATQGAPRKIAPAKPSRPTITREIKKLATKPIIKAPSLPQKVKSVTNTLRKFKGKGKVGLALAGAGLIGSTIMSLRSKNKN